MSDKPFLTITQQIDLLKSRNLKFISEETAEKELTRFGYYEIINGYKKYFLLDPSDDEQGYKPDANFEHIFAMYKFDKAVRELVLETLEEFEQTFKQSLAYVIAENISDKQQYYTAKSHYNSGETYQFRGKDCTDRDRLLKKFDRLLNAKFEPYNHYSNNHGNIPPWILVKGLTFGEAIYWFRLSKKDIRLKVISRLFGNPVPLITASNKVLGVTQIFSDLLMLYLDYRNLTAHGGRVFEHRSAKHEIRHYSRLLYNSQISSAIDISKREFLNGKCRSSVGTIAYSLALFDNRSTYPHMVGRLVVCLREHLQNYPEDKEMLLECMELTDGIVEALINPSEN